MNLEVIYAKINDFKVENVSIIGHLFYFRSDVCEIQNIFIKNNKNLSHQTIIYIKT